MRFEKYCFKKLTTGDSAHKIIRRKNHVKNSMFLILHIHTRIHGEGEKNERQAADILE